MKEKTKYEAASMYVAGVVSDNVTSKIYTSLVKFYEKLGFSITHEDGECAIMEY